LRFSGFSSQSENVSQLERNLLLIWLAVPRERESLAEIIFSRLGFVLRQSIYAVLIALAALGLARCQPSRWNAR
jgi:hypothetical protein